MTTRQKNLDYQRGDVIMGLFPHPDLRTAKLHPALIIQAAHLQTGLPQVIVAIITSRLFPANHPNRVTVQRASLESQQSGLMTDSGVVTDNLATIAENEIYRMIGALPMAEIDRVLRHTLDL